MRRINPVCRLVLSCLMLLGISVFLVLSSSGVRANGSSWQQFTYYGSEGSRPYFVYTPENYHVGVAVPLVVMLHGCTQTAADFAAGTKMNQLADQDTFIVVYPQQIGMDNQDLCWNWFESSNQMHGSGEPAIIAGIVKAVEQNVSQWTIDTRRVYVAGFSAGAAMAVILGATYPDIFAAIGVHSGMEYQAASNAFDSLKAMSHGGPDPQQQGIAAFDAMGTITRIVPTIVFQGASDQMLQPINGDQVIQQWMRTNQLASNGTYTAEFDHANKIESGQVPFGHSYSVFKWNDNHSNEIQEYWKIDSMGHAWSGGSPIDAYTDSSGPDASMAMI